CFATYLYSLAIISECRASRSLACRVPAGRRCVVAIAAAGRRWYHPSKRALGRSIQASAEEVAGEVWRLHVLPEPGRRHHAGVRRAPGRDRADGGAGLRRGLARRAPLHLLRHAAIAESDS